MLNDVNPYTCLVRVDVQPVPVGSQMAKMEGLMRLSDSQGGVSVGASEGEVIVVEFWAAWCKPSLKNVARLRDIAQAKKKEWEGKVKIVTLSVDESFEKA